VRYRIAVESVGPIDGDSGEDGEGDGALQFEGLEDCIDGELQLNLLKVL
jgi:hypothetical protein